MPQYVALSKITKEFTFALAAEGKRVDGRAFDEFRPIQIKTRFVKKAEGSAEVRLGHTRVLCGVKLKPGVPYPDAPDAGTMTTSAEMNPLAAPDFEAGPPRPEAIELARVVDRGVRESGLIDFKKLCEKVGETVWTVFVDIHVLDYDGNLFDACSMAALAAVLTAKVPRVQYKLGDKDIPLPLTTTEPPISATVAKIGSALMIDPNLDEDLVFDARLTVACDVDGNIRAMQKGGSGSFSVDEVRKVIKMSQSGSALIRQVIHDAAAKGEASVGAKSEE